MRMIISHRSLCIHCDRSRHSMRLSRCKPSKLWPSSGLLKMAELLNRWVEKMCWRQSLMVIVTHLGKISAQPYPTVCIQFFNRENNDKNYTFPLGKKICFTITWRRWDCWRTARARKAWLSFCTAPYNCKTNLFSQWKCIVFVIVFSVEELNV